MLPVMDRHRQERISTTIETDVAASFAEIAQARLLTSEMSRPSKNLTSRTFIPLDFRFPSDRVASSELQDALAVFFLAWVRDYSSVWYDERL